MALCKESFPCTVEVFRLAVPGEVPLDRAIVTAADEEVAMFISRGSNVIVVIGFDGTEVFRQTISH